MGKTMHMQGTGDIWEISAPSQFSDEPKTALKIKSLKNNN